MFSPEQIRSLFEDKRLRLFDQSRMAAISNSLLLNPNCQPLQIIFGSEVAKAEALYKEAKKLNPFHERIPPKGALPQATQDRLALHGIPTGEVVSISKQNELPVHIGIFGASGGGKTNTMRSIAVQCLNDDISIVVLDSKEDFVACSSLKRENVRVLSVDRIPLALLQPPPEQKLNEFIEIWADMFARSLNIYASKLYLIDKLHQLYHENQHPSYRQLLQLIEREKPERNYGSLADYREKILSYGKLLDYALGTACDFAHSEALNEVFSHRGLTIIRCSQLSSAVRTFYAAYLLNYVFQRRRNPKNVTHLVLIMMDDAQELLSGGMYQEATDRLSPVVQRALDARSRRIGLVAGLQSFQHTSPAFKSQCSTMLFTATRGTDAFAVQQWLGLSNEETSKLQNFMPGETLSRTALAGVQYGVVPLIA